MNRRDFLELSTSAMMLALPAQGQQRRKIAALSTTSHEREKFGLHHENAIGRTASHCRRISQKLLVADSGRRNIRVFDMCGDGTLRNGQVLCELTTESPGGPDGLKTDETGNIWVAGPGGIWVFGAKGVHLGTVAIPEAPSNCAWGAGFRNLYVTARTSVYRLETKVSGTRTY